MFFVDSKQRYMSPESSRVHLIRDINLLNPMTYDEIMDITKSPYSNESWSKLAYNVSKSSFRPYYNEDLGKIADRNIAKGNWLIDETSVNCLFYETYLRMPSVCDWTRHFMYFTEDNFLGSLGIYALQLETDVSENMALRHVANIAQYQLVSKSPFNRFMVAIHRDKSQWELAYGYIVEEHTPLWMCKSRRVRISWFKEPSKFFKELLSGGIVNNIHYEEYEVSVRN
jgi:hypothetical protein